METGKRRTLLDVMNEVDRRDEPVPRSDFEDLEARVAELEAQHNTAQAVIDAARAVMKHVHVKEAWGRLGSQVVDVAAKEGSHTLMAQYYAADPFPDTLLGTLAGLVAALEAHDEATDESEDA